MKTGPYREGKVHVLKEPCSTCVFKPGNLMRLDQGRLKDLVEDNLRLDTALQCHQTLGYYPGDQPPAVCRGYYDAYKQEVTPLRLAMAMDMIVEDDLEPAKEN